MALMGPAISMHCGCSRSDWCPEKTRYPAWAWVLHTLVGDPLSLLNGLWSGTQGHEVALDNMLGIVWVEPQRNGPREMLLFEAIKTTSHQATLLVHSNRLRKRRGLGQRWEVGREAG